MAEDTSVNIRPTLSMYWEADRSTVKARYDALFPPLAVEEADQPSDNPDSAPLADQPEKASHTATPPADWETRWDETFRLQLAEYNLGQPITLRLQEIWARLPQSARPIALHHLQAITARAWTFRYILEGLVNCFALPVATQVLHCVYPEAVFPIDAEVSYFRLKAILRILGIIYDDSEGLTPVEVAENISYAVHDFNTLNDWKPWQTWAMVYDLGPRLLPDPKPYPTDTLPKVWIVSANERSGDFERCDLHTNSEIIDWSINSRAKRGDIALMYHLAPRSAFVSVHRCFSDSFVDRIGAETPWTGESALLTDRIAIPWLTLKEMKQDEVLRKWGLVKRNFIGMLQSDVPPDIWYRIRDLITQKDAEVGKFLGLYAAAAGGVHSIAAVGEDISEEEVENTLVVPLLRALGWIENRNLQRQYEMNIKIGSGKPKRVRADFVGFRDSLGSEVLMVLETKYRIRSERELSEAVGQCESYSGKLRCPRFVVAAPEGLWIYKMNFPGYSDLLLHVPLQREVPPLTMQKIRPLLEFAVLKEGVQ